MTQTSSTPDPLGMTLAEYAAWRGKHPQAVRPDYAALFRQGTGAHLPSVTRQNESEGVIKFCLPAGESAPPLPPPLAPPLQPLETESVIIPMNSYRGTAWHTLCVSTQVGCRMGCTFCETGRMGLLRNLTAAEIVRQRLVARHVLTSRLSPRASAQGLGSSAIEDPTESDPKGSAPWARRGPRYFSDGIQNLVFMGMGEPLDNFDHVVQAIRVLHEPAGLDFPHTQITLSTVGRIDGLKKLAALGWINLRLAISLNAATDALRNQLMPINKGMPLRALQQALLEYPLAKKGRFLIEYVLIKGVNDSPADADAVAEWCRPLPCVVNLIPYNPQRFASFETPADETIQAFLFRLKDHGIFVKRRISHGRDLMGACGQLGNPEVRRQRTC